MPSADANFLLRETFSRIDYDNIRINVLLQNVNVMCQFRWKFNFGRINSDNDFGASESRS